jgi:hypothetical protein
MTLRKNPSLAAARRQGDIINLERGLYMKNEPRGRKFLLLAFCLALFSPGLRADPTPAPTPDTTDPFAYSDFSWMNGNSRWTDNPLDSKYFTPQMIVDVNYVHSFNNPNDHTISGSTSEGRSDEFQVQQFGIGGDLHVDNVRGRFMTGLGMDSQMVPRNDTTPARGQWNLNNAYGDLTEAYAGYHWDIWNGINLDAGLFPSYIGLYNYYNTDNWTYQASYVSSNTPWFFNGVRLQIFPTDNLKTEFWLINGWQTYGMFNDKLAFGYQIKYANQAGWFSSVYNGYVGWDTPDSPDLIRVHSDNSWLAKDYDNPDGMISKNAWSLTADIGGEQGDMGNGANSSTIPVTMGPGPNEEAFFGAMAYNRTWFDKGKYAFTWGGGFVNNPGRYLLLVPPVNGATAGNYGDQISLYDTAKDPEAVPTLNPGDAFIAENFQIAFDWMPSQYILYRLEFAHDIANTNYFTGEGGVTSSDGWSPQATGSTNTPGAWRPDLTNVENRIELAMEMEI